VVEEAHELAAECRGDPPDRAKMMHELADVVFAATVVAEHCTLRIEDSGEQIDTAGSGCG
jgi:hypothetical protein